MSWKLYDYVDKDGVNQFREWCLRLQKPELAKVEQRLTMLELHGPGLAPQMLAGPLRGWRHIYKLKFNGRTAPRPMLCKGTVEPNSEFTLLLGAFEVGSEYVPPKAPEIAEGLRQQVAADPKRRRRPHEWIKRQPEGQSTAGQLGGPIKGFVQ